MGKNLENISRNISSLKKSAISAGAGIGLSLLALLAPNAKADTHYVSTNGFHQAPYTNWVGAATNIQSAVDAASDNDSVIIADGKYYVAPTNGISWNALSPVKHITLASENGPENCIIDCQSKGRAFTLDAGQNTNDTLNGLTIKNGKPVPADFKGGGAIYLNRTSPNIRNCYFASNNASADGYGADGGAINTVSNASPTIEDCFFYRNKGTHHGGAGCSTKSSPTIRRCVFQENFGQSCNGGGAWVFVTLSSGLFENNLAFSNRAQKIDAGPTTNGGLGGAVSCQNSDPVIRYCTFARNSTVYTESNRGRGGALFAAAGSPKPKVYNCIFSDNLSTNGEENIGSSGILDLTYCDIFPANTFTSAVPASNISADPLFIEAANGNFRIQEGSSCINSGTNLEWMSAGVDLDGNPRKMGSRVDMGAYERIPSVYKIITSKTTNGVIIPAGTNDIESMESITFTMLADTGYELDKACTNSIQIGGLSGGASNNFTWSRIIQDGTFSADFKKRQLNLQVESAYGTATGAGTYSYGDSATSTVERTINFAPGNKKRVTGYALENQ